MLWHSVKSWVWLNPPARLSDLGSLSMASQRFCIHCALGIVAAPVVLAGFLKTLAHKHAGTIVLCVYLIPTLIVALVYRIGWAFSLHILCLYHTLALFCWVSILRSARSRLVLMGLTLIALEGIICVLFADTRFLPLHGLRLAQVPAAHFIWVGAYFALILVMIAAVHKELDLHPQSTGRIPVLPNISASAFGWLVGRRLLLGLLVTALVVGIYSIYCLRFYPAP
jgi:hypothetical protein